MDFPPHPSRRSAATPSPLGEGELRDKKILLIGDCPDIYLLSSLLVRQHAQVTLVGEGNFSIKESWVKNTTG